MKLPTLSRPSGWTLRTRLLAALIALLAAVSVIIGLVSVLALNRSLQDRVDDQLRGAVGRSQEAYRDPQGVGGGRPPPLVPPPAGRGGPPPRDHGTGPDSLFVPGQAEGTLNARGACTTAGDSGVLDRTGYSRPLDADQCATLTALPADGRPRTVDLGGTLGTYRVTAARTDDGTVIVTGLPLRSLRSTVYGLAAVVAVVALLGLVLATLAGAAVIRLTLRPLRRVAATAGRVAELPLDRGEVALAVRVPEADTDARTEVGQVGAALNRMLGHISHALTARQASEARVRKFVADASHELRTPLASIRGYAELTRRSHAEVPPEVAHALSRVESEAVRMTSLVEDLLLLARLDSGRPVERRPVDLSAMVVNAVSDAHAAGPEHRWQLDLPDEPVIVTGDQGRLHQVVANLLANARSHTPPGTDVTVHLGVDNDVVLRVLDNGPGIPLELQPEVFERFTRGDTSRSRANGSTGLGLAIVAAVVEAHHGTVTVDSTPGHTAFTIRLPRDDT
jgi:two-component system OmpR family sensor kinase